MNLKNIALASALALGTVGTSAAVAKTTKSEKAPEEITQNITHNLSGADYVNYVMPQKVTSRAAQSANSVDNNYYSAVSDFSDLTHENRVNVLSGVADSLKNIVVSENNIRKSANKSVSFMSNPTGEALIEVASEIVSNPYTKNAFLKAVKNYDSDAAHPLYKLEALMTNKNSDSFLPEDKLMDLIDNKNCALPPKGLENVVELFKDWPSDATAEDLIYLFGDYANEMYETRDKIVDGSLANDVELFNALGEVENTGKYKNDIDKLLKFVGTTGIGVKSRITDLTKNVFTDKVEQAKTAATSVEDVTVDKPQTDVKKVKTDKGVFIIKTTQTPDGAKTETFDMSGKKVSNLD